MLPLLWGRRLATRQDPDCTWLERALGDIEARSARLVWHREAGTRWEAAERVDVEWSDALGALPRVDLHGLDQRLAGEAVALVLAGRSHLRAPAVRFVTGSGTHSTDGRGVLGEVVETCVGDVRGVSLHPSGGLPWRDVILTATPARAGAAPMPPSAPRGERVRRRHASPSRPPAPPPGLLGRLFQGLVTGLVGALVGAVARTFAAAFGAPGRAVARMLTRRRTRKRRRR